MPLRQAARRTAYLVRSGDKWPLIASRYGVTAAQLQAWNPDVERLHPRTELTLQVSPDLPPSPAAGLDLDRDPTGLPLVPVPGGGESRGHPAAGRLAGGVQLPENPALYLVRRPEFAYGSSHTVETLQLAIGKFRAHSGYQGPLVISDMSRRRGGKLRPHRSHQSGRDVDIWLPLRSELVDADRGRGEHETGDDTLGHWELGARRASEIDWRATLALIEALVRTAEVRFIFLSRNSQRHLFRAARAEGWDRATVSRLIEYPARDRDAVVRHARRHGMHIHVRFRCAPWERRCY